MKDRGYVELRHKRLQPTEKGQQLCAFLIAHFGDVLAFDYTAQMEDQLDRVANGDLTRLEMLRLFWQSFEAQLRQATGSALKPPQPKPLLLRPAEE